MKSTAEEHRLGRPRPARSGFSLAELMIALAILAMGLLVIGAALPIGVRYTQQSAEIDTGAAAAEYALDLVEQSLVLCYSTTDLNTAAPTAIRSPVIFQPRYEYTRPSKGFAAVAASSSSSSSSGSSSSSSGASSVSGTGGVPYEPTHPGSAKLDWEPLIKVRPLMTANVYMNPNPAVFGTQLPFPPIEACVGRYLSFASLLGGLDPNEFTMEYDTDPNNGITPALPCTAVVYPPIATRYSSTNPVYLPTMYPGNAAWGPDVAERTKLLERRTVWTAFYRRVSYGGSSDPSLFEIIVVVSRRPTENHRFALQGGDGDYAGADTLAPVPWLVTFFKLPTPQGGSPPFFENGDPKLGQNDRVLRFRTMSQQVSDLLPVGAVFIPARNDNDPNAPAVTQPVGLSPVTPNALPIYRVVDRPDANTIMVENNGFFPRQTLAPESYGTPPGNQWPVWVIPPAFAKYDNGGEPLYDGESSILTVARRYVYVHEAN